MEIISSLIAERAYTPPRLLQHIPGDDLQLYLLGRLPAETVSLIDSHLTGCNKCGGRLVEAVRFLSRLAKLNDSQVRSDRPERRCGPRFAINEPVVVQPLHPFSSHSVDATLENVSRGGMQLRSPALLGTGTLIKLHLHSAVMFGEVRYCAALGGHFFLGVQFSDAV